MTSRPHSFNLTPTPTSAMKLAIALLITLGSIVFAAEPLDRFKPKQPEPLAKDQIPQPDEKPTIVKPPGDTQGGVKLRGIIFVGSTPQLRVKGAPATDGVLVEGVPMLNNPGFTSGMQKAIGQPVSLDFINPIAAETARYYKQHDHPVVSVVAPEQDVTNGVVQLLVTEARVGQVHVAGNNWFKSSLFQDPRIKPGDPIIMSRLEADTAFYGRNPFRSVTAELSPGANSGETDITLRVQDKFPLRVFRSATRTAESSPPARTGLFAGLQLRQPLRPRPGAQLPVHDERRLRKARSRTRRPGRSRCRGRHPPVLRRLFRVRSRSSPTAFDMLRHELAGGRALHPPLPPNLGRIKHELSLGYDFKYTDNNLQFGGTQVFDTPVEISEFSLGYSASLAGQTRRAPRSRSPPTGVPAA